MGDEKRRGDVLSIIIANALDLAESHGQYRLSLLQGSNLVFLYAEFYRVDTAEVEFPVTKRCCIFQKESSYVKTEYDAWFPALGESLVLFHGDALKYNRLSVLGGRRMN